MLYNFKPFEQVLVRDTYDILWHARLYDHYYSSGERKGYHETQDGRIWKECIPYKGNEKLLEQEESVFRFGDKVMAKDEKSNWRRALFLNNATNMNDEHYYHVHFDGDIAESYTKEIKLGWNN